MAKNLTDTRNSNFINLDRLVLLRLIVIVGEIFAIYYAVSDENMLLPLTSLVTILAAMTLISLLTLIRLRMAWPVHDAELFAQFTLDIFALTGMLYFTGGSTNPFAPLYLLPLTFTAAILPATYTWAMFVLAVSCYSLLLFFYIPLPEMHGSHDHGFQMHIFGMWLGFLLSAVLIAGFVVRMSNTVRRQDMKISKMREQQIRQEHILSLGTLAAGAAHELGTPLSTMAILLKDQKPEHPISAGSLEILKEQLSRCKSILGSISAASGHMRAESGRGEQIDQYLRQIISRWLSSRPNVNAEVVLDGYQPAQFILADQTLEQALLNIFNNAADASPHDIKITGRWDKQLLVVEVADRGEGLSPEIADKAGESIHSTKQDGLGLGLFLTYATLERLGGKVQLFNREGGGVLCQVMLPLENIQITKDYD